MNKDRTLERKWEKLRVLLKQVVGRKPKDLNAVLFLVGIQELGKGPASFSKEQKQDLMHIAICKVLSKDGFYQFEGMDDDGWPHWKNTKPLPHGDLIAQEELLKQKLIEYFEDEIKII